MDASILATIKARAGAKKPKYMFMDCADKYNRGLSVMINDVLYYHYFELNPKPKLLKLLKELMGDMYLDSFKYANKQNIATCIRQLLDVQVPAELKQFCRGPVNVIHQFDDIPDYIINIGFDINTIVKHTEIIIKSQDNTAEHKIIWPLELNNRPELISYCLLIGIPESAVKQYFNWDELIAILKHKIKFRTGA